MFADHITFSLTISKKIEPLGLSQYNLVLNEGNKLFFKCNKVV